MTHERLEELHEQAVIEHLEHLTQELSDALTQRMLRDGALSGPTVCQDELIVVPCNHESQLQSYMQHTQLSKETLNSVIGEDRLLEEHYRDGGPHPHDYKLPLNMWEDIPD